jgi:hypothetical protein
VAELSARILFAATAVALLTLPMNTCQGQQGIPAADQIYGHEADPTGDPVGGGEGYSSILMFGDFTVTNADELIEALKQAQAGQVVYVPDGVEVDLTNAGTLRIPGGVTLAGSRGHDGSAGALIVSNHESRLMLATGGAHVRVTGLRFEGAHGGNDRSAIASNFMSISHYDAEVDNCEIYNFNVSGIGVGVGGMGAYIHHNYLHHIWRAGLGYPVSTSGGDTRIIANRFDCGRHHVASSGSPGSGYEFAYNWIGPEAISHHVDVHGGRDRGDGTDIAGDWMHVHHNTFMGTRRPVAIRGVPSQGAWIHNNWFHDFETPGKEVLMPWPPNEGTNIHFYNNAYGVDKMVIE